MEQANQQSQRKKHVIIGTVSVILVVSLLLTAFTGSSGGSGAGAAQEETLYRESTVTRGDLTVGVTESTSATLKTHAIYFDFTLSSSSSASSNNNQTTNTTIAIEEIFVKAGQRVSTGDPLVQLSSSDIQEAISELQSDYQEALVSLTEAQLSLQKGQLDARNTYDSTMLTSESADATYDITIEQLELSVKNAQKEVDNLKAEIATYTRLLRLIDSDGYWDYVNIKEWYSTCKERVESCKELLKKYESSADYEKDSTEHQRLQYNLENAEDDLYYAKTEYEEIGSVNIYNDAYETDLTEEDEIEKARETAREKLETAEANLRQAEYNLSTKGATAQQDKSKAASQAEIADTTYQLQISQLENNVESKQLSANNIQDSIAKLQGYLDETTLVSPCDGVITQVNYSAGDSATSGTTILSVSDSANVFVYVSVAQDDILGITLGQSASLTLDAFDTLTFEGEVDGISTTPARSASGSASYNVTIRVLGDASQIYEGMTGTATLITKQVKDVLYVSTRTVYAEDGQSYVKVKDEDGNLIPTPVTTGFSDGRNVEITEGLAEGQIVIIESQVSAA